MDNSLPVIGQHSGRAAASAAVPMHGRVPSSAAPGSYLSTGDSSPSPGTCTNTRERPSAAAQRPAWAGCPLACAAAQRAEMRVVDPFPPWVRRCGGPSLRNKWRGYRCSAEGRNATIHHGAKTEHQVAPMWSLRGKDEKKSFCRHATEAGDRRIWRKNAFGEGQNAEEWNRQMPLPMYT
jgi:hypothetical protein